MNLRKKNKKLKRELESARTKLADVEEFAAYYLRNKRELYRQCNSDLATLHACVHRPEYMGLSEEQLKIQIVERIIPELAKCIILECRADHDDFVHASIRVVKPRE